MIIQQGNGMVSTLYKPRWQMFIDFPGAELKKDTTMRYKKINRIRHLVILHIFLNFDEIIEIMPKSVFPGINDLELTETFSKADVFRMNISGLK